MGLPWLSTQPRQGRAKSTVEAYKLVLMVLSSINTAKQDAYVGLIVGCLLPLSADPPNVATETASTAEEPVSTAFYRHDYHSQGMSVCNGLVSSGRDPSMPCPAVSSTGTCVPPHAGHQQSVFVCARP
jgi:hypothetical protein